MHSLAPEVAGVPSKPRPTNTQRGRVAAGDGPSQLSHSGSVALTQRSNSPPPSAGRANHFNSYAPSTRTSSIPSAPVASDHQPTALDGSSTQPDAVEDDDDFFFSQIAPDLDALISTSSTSVRSDILQHAPLHAAKDNTQQQFRGDIPSPPSQAPPPRLELQRAVPTPQPTLAALPAPLASSLASPMSSIAALSQRTAVSNFPAPSSSAPVRALHTLALAPNYQTIGDAYWLV